MSAFVVPKAHIDAMIRRGLALMEYGPLSWYTKDLRDVQSSEKLGDIYRRLTDETADAVGQMLIDECVKSVSYRYKDSNLTDLPGPINAYWLIPYKYQMSWGARMPNPVETLKLINCYDYQSCEHPEWHDSEAKRFCDSLRHAMISMLPGYDEAAWEWGEPSEALAPTPPDPEGRMKTPYNFPLSKMEIDMAEARSMAPTPPEGGMTMLKREDFNVLANSRGYNIEYRGHKIGGAGIAREAPGPHGSDYWQHVKDYLNAGERDVEEILAGKGPKSMMLEVARIDAEFEDMRPGKPNCRYCQHLVDVRPPGTKHYIGACEYRLRPATCGKFELAKIYEGHDPRLEAPTPPADRTEIMLGVKECDICNEVMKAGDIIVTMHQATVTAEIPDGLTVSEEKNVNVACHAEHVEATLGLDIVAPTPPALSADEKAIPGFGETFERCVLETKVKGGAVNPYAVCRASLRRSHGLPVGSKN